MSEQQYPPAVHFQYDRIAQSKALSSVTKLLALRLKSQQYITLKQFFDGLSTKDIDDLAELIERFEEARLTKSDDRNACMELILLTQMLCGGEACFIESYTHLDKLVNKFIILVASAALERRGYIKVCWENASFGDEYDDKPLAQKLED